MQIITRKLFIGTSVNQSIELPVLEVGSGKPRICLVGGIHGNEPEGLFIIREVLRKLEHPAGMLRIISGANPYALIHKTREGAFDSIDMNRVFPGNEKGKLTERIAAAIVKECIDSDIVIDIHSTTDWGEFMGMQLSTRDKLLIEQTNNIIRTLKPPVIWRAVDGTTYLKTLAEYCLSQGICGAAIEVPRLELLTRSHMERIVRGLIDIIEYPHRKAPILEKSIPVIGNERKYFSDKGGIYVPVKKVLAEVESGDVIGTITDIVNYEDAEVTTKWSGIISVHATRKVVTTGERLFHIAEKLDEFV